MAERISKNKDLPPNPRVVMGRGGRIYIVGDTEEKRTPESTNGFARGLRSQVLGIIDECCDYCFDPSYKIDKNGNIRFAEVSLIRKLSEEQ